MDSDYVRSTSPQLRINSTVERTSTMKTFSKEKVVKTCSIAAQVLHFLISMCYVWAGLVEFIRDPPFFDAYGDANTSIDLPKGFLVNDPRKTESEILRLMDLPILVMLIAYKAVCIWFRYRGLSWLSTICFTITFVIFWVVNFWDSTKFDWRIYSRRMIGLQLQVSFIALSATTVFMLIFYKRKKWPFKFKSSLSIKHNSALHVIWNFLAIYLVMFASLMVWFVKLYASWACFNTGSEIMELCSTTSEVQCYSCSKCSHPALRKCVADDKTETFTCTTRFKVDKGAFCVFNYNMSIYGFLFTFAYIGGLGVFLSTFLRIIGHYALRGFFLAYENVLKCYERSPGKRRTEWSTIRRQHQDTEMQNPSDLNSNNASIAEDPVTYVSESDDDGNILISAAFG